MTAKTKRLRELLASGEFLYMPSAATPLEGRLAEAAGTPLVYTGGYVSGASRVDQRAAVDDGRAGAHRRRGGARRVGAADRRCRRRVRRAAAHDAHGARIRRRRGRRHPYRGPALPEAGALSRLSGACDPARRVRRQDQICLPPARRDRPRFRRSSRAATRPANSVSTRRSCASTRRPRSAPISVSSSRAAATRPKRRRACRRCR